MEDRYSKGQRFRPDALAKDLEVVAVEQIIVGRHRGNDQGYQQIRCYGDEEVGGMDQPSLY